MKLDVGLKRSIHQRDIQQSTPFAMSTNGVKANNVAIPLEKQLSEILLQLGKGQQLQTAPKRKQVIHEILSDLKNSFLKCTILPYGLDELGISSDSSALYLSVDTFGKVDAEGNKNLQGCINLNTSTYSAIAQQIFKILTTSSSSSDMRIGKTTHSGN